MMPRFVLTILLCCFATFCLSQTVYKIGGDIPSPDLTVSISENESYPDIKVKIGSNLPTKDFTVGRTYNLKEASFIITKRGSYGSYDYKIKYGSNISYPDLKIRIGQYIEYPDIRISIIRYGIVDYLYYDDSDYDEEEDEYSDIFIHNKTNIVLAFLTIINKKLKYKFDNKMSKIR